jgi:enamine deaminase RidA (YjgF/YER057c/UK114 family)
VRGTRTSVVVLLVVLALFAGACSSSAKTSEPRSAVPTTDAVPLTRPADATTAPGSSTPRSSSPSYSDQDLEKMLVPLDDAPDGFKVQPSPGASDDDQSRLCDANSLPRSKKTGAADVSYVGGQVAVLSETLTSYASTKDAEAVMRNARAALHRCKTFDRTDDKGRVTHYVVAPLSFDRLSDDQVALRQTFKGSAANGTGDVVAARVGNVIMLTAGIAVPAKPVARPLEPGDFASFTKAAYARIK